MKSPLREVAGASKMQESFRVSFLIFWETAATTSEAMATTDTATAAVPPDPATAPQEAWMTLAMSSAVMALADNTLVLITGATFNARNAAGVCPEAPRSSLARATARRLGGPVSPLTPLGGSLC